MIAFGIFAGFVILSLYACMKVGSDEDDRMELDAHTTYYRGGDRCVSDKDNQ